MVLSEKYYETLRDRMENEQRAEKHVIDLETHPNMKDVQTQLSTPRKKSRLLSLAGAMKGAKDLASNKKKYTYYSMLKFFQVDRVGMLRMTSSARYFK